MNCQQQGITRVPVINCQQDKTVLQSWTVNSKVSQSSSHKLPSKQHSSHASVCTQNKRSIKGEPKRRRKLGWKSKHCANNSVCVSIEVFGCPYHYLYKRSTFSCYKPQILSMQSCWFDLYQTQKKAGSQCVCVCVCVCVYMHVCAWGGGVYTCVGGMGGCGVHACMCVCMHVASVKVPCTPILCSIKN